MLDVAEPQQRGVDSKRADYFLNDTRYRGRGSFYDYRQIIDPNLIHGWWHWHASWQLQYFYNALVAGKRPKLIIMAPPQHGKSRMINDFMSWCAGRDPSLRIIYASYSDELRTTSSLQFERTLMQDSYRWVFSNVRLPVGSESWQNNTTIRDFVRTDGASWRQAGSLRCTTVDGQVTGFGLDLGVIDDPIKGRAEAHSPTIRDKTWNWMVEDFFSRFSARGGMLMIMTRWHVDDPAGRWVQKFPETKVLRYPAIAEDEDENDWSVRRGFRERGEALFKEWKPLSFLRERERSYTRAAWLALYQQRPIIGGGGVFPVGRITIVPGVDRKQVKRSVLYCDKAGTKDGGARTAIVLMHMTHDNTYVVEQAVTGQWESLERERRLLQMATSCRAFCPSLYVWVEQEPGSGGKESAEASIRNLKGFRVAADKVTGSKEVRAEPYAAQVQGGNVRRRKASGSKDSATLPDPILYDDAHLARWTKRPGDLAIVVDWPAFEQRRHGLALVLDEHEAVVPRRYHDSLMHKPRGHAQTDPLSRGGVHRTPMTRRPHRHYRIANVERRCAVPSTSTNCHERHRSAVTSSLCHFRLSANAARFSPSGPYISERNQHLPSSGHPAVS
jgi:hypothetical protein